MAVTEGRRLVGDRVRSAATRCPHRVHTQVALDSLYRQDPESDVRRGLLKIVINVLHHHGDELTRGWVPLLRCEHHKCGDVSCCSGVVGGSGTGQEGGRPGLCSLALRDENPATCCPSLPS